MTEAAISVEGLRKRFGDVVALDGIDFAVPEGSIFGLLGPNGAGKTTAVRILTTILAPDGGTARVLGRDVTKDADFVRASIGLAGQFAAVDEQLTGRENLRLIGKLTHMPRDMIKPRADELIERFDLADAANRPSKTYSGGMKRRLDVAAALMHKPPVLFLDEPTTGLDPASRADVWVMVEELVADGTTVLLTTQYLEEADRLAKDLAVVDHGRVIASGSPAKLKATIGTTVIDFGFASQATAKRAATALQKLPKVEPQLDTTMVEINAKDGAKLLPEALRALDKSRIKPATINLREPSLDDVFLALTGHKAEEEVV